MNRLAQILPKENVRISLKATSKKRVFEQASLIFESRCKIARSKIFNSLFSREKLGSTGLGNGIAIPHGRLEGLKKSVAVVLSLDVPIPFDAIDEKAVDLLIFLLVPTSSSKVHLEILAEVDMIGLFNFSIIVLQNLSLTILIAIVLFLLIAFLAIPIGFS